MPATTKQAETIAELKAKRGRKAPSIPGVAGMLTSQTHGETP